ncbi:MAG TPA: DUF6784 domain-containing protein [Chthonomonadales bacterium]|nr:DUF6784 domain-containing protein [Chthonomonadales bacterium]
MSAAGADDHRGCPFHPVGYASAASCALVHLRAPFLPTRTPKPLIARHEGLKADRRAMPFLLWFPIGGFATVISWGAVTSRVGLKGASVAPAQSLVAWGSDGYLRCWRATPVW